MSNAETGFDDAGTRTARLQALTDRWIALRRGHSVVSAGCSCGMNGTHVSVVDFEQDLIDYLRARWSDEFSAFIDPALGANGVGMETLLRSLATTGLPAQSVRRLIDDIDKAIDSFGGRRLATGVRRF